MASQLSITRLCELALRKIGTFSIHDTAADAGELEEARYWLDMLVGHVAARKRCWWLVPSTQSIALVAGRKTYDLTQLLGGLDGGMQFPIKATIGQTSGNDFQPIDLLRRKEYESVGDLDTPGLPRAAYIDRQRDATMYLYPVPDASVAGYEIRLVIQKLTEDLTRGEISRRPADLHQSWQLCLVSGLAAEIGDGPVRKLPKDEVEAMRKRAKELVEELEDYEIEEHADQPRRTSYREAWE